MANNMPPLEHPNLYNKLDRFFPHTCTIKKQVEDTDDWGEPINTWEPIEGLEDLKAARGRTSSNPQQDENKDYTVYEYSIRLQDHYPEIRKGMRAYIEEDQGIYYNIKAVDHNLQKTATRLICEVVSL